MEISSSIKQRFFQEIKGEVFFDELTRRLYAYSASICYLIPAGVIYPQDKEDVLQAVRIAAEEGIPLTARGCGSGVAGQNLGEGIILDFSVHMNKLIHFNRVESSVTVQPGLVRTELLKAIRSQGLFFPPDPSSSDYASLGGMTANNSGGAHSLLYGTTKNYVKSLKAITPEAEEIMVTSAGSAPIKYKKQVEELLREAQSVLTKNKPESFRNSCGYNLFEALSGDGVDFTRIFCGSEGTLSIFTEIDLALVPIPPFRYSVLLCYRDCLQAFTEIKGFLDLKPSTIQVLAQEFLKLIASEEPENYNRLPKGTEFIILAEFDGSNPDDLEKKAKELIKRSSAFFGRFAKDPAEMAWVWAIRRSAAAYLSRIPGRKPVRWIEDAAVPAERLLDFVMGLEKLLQKYNTSAALFGHAGQGLLHFSPRLDRFSPEFPDLIEKLGREHALFSRSLKGVPSGEHGDGLLRTPYLKEIWGEVYPYFQRLKKIFDPNFRFNPLSIIPVRDYRVKEFLKYYEGYKHIECGALNRVKVEIEDCHGCGKCISFCPVIRSVRGERAISRARVNLLREIIAGHLDKPFERKDLNEFFNLCLHCKTCHRECGTKVDVARLIETFYEEKYRHRQAPISERLLSQSKRMGKLVRNLWPLSRLALGFKLTKKIAAGSGMANLDSLRFDFLKKEPVEDKIRQEREKVVLFSGCSGDFFNFSEIKAAFELLDILNYQAELLDGLCCGEPAFVRGFTEKGRAQLLESLKKLKPYINEGVPVVFTSPSCMMPFKEHSVSFPELLGEQGKNGEEGFHEAVDFIYSCFKKAKAEEKENIFEAKVNLNLQNKGGSAFSPVKLKVAAQVPCHLKILGKEKSLFNFLNLLPGVEVIGLETSCCGFGGSRGFEKKWVHHAEKIGKELVAEIHSVNPEIVVSSCVTCRLQIRKLLGIQNLNSEKESLKRYFLTEKFHSKQEIQVVHPLVLVEGYIAHLL